MPINEEIKAAIHHIDQRLAKLRKIREMLLEEFGVETEAIQSSRGKPSSRHRSRQVPRAKKTRKQDVIAFLKSNGPTRRRDILEKMGMPKGTIAFVLADKKTFIRLEDGRWDLRKGGATITPPPKGEPTEVQTKK